MEEIEFFPCAITVEERVTLFVKNNLHLIHAWLASDRKQNGDTILVLPSEWSKNIGSPIKFQETILPKSDLLRVLPYIYESTMVAVNLNIRITDIGTARKGVTRIILLAYHNPASEELVFLHPSPVKVEYEAYYSKGEIFVPDADEEEESMEFSSRYMSGGDCR